MPAAWRFLLRKRMYVLTEWIPFDGHGHDCSWDENRVSWVEKREHFSLKTTVGHQAASLGRGAALLRSRWCPQVTRAAGGDGGTSQEASLGAKEGPLLWISLGKEPTMILISTE